MRELPVSTGASSSGFQLSPTRYLRDTSIVESSCVHVPAPTWAHSGTGQSGALRAPAPPVCFPLHWPRFSAIPVQNPQLHARLWEPDFLLGPSTIPFRVVVQAQYASPRPISGCHQNSRYHKSKMRQLAVSRATRHNDEHRSLESAETRGSTDGQLTPTQRRLVRYITISTVFAQA